VARRRFDGVPLAPITLTFFGALDPHATAIDMKLLPIVCALISGVTP
jgi:hypothetical protein